MEILRLVGTPAVDFEQVVENDAVELIRLLPVDGMPGALCHVVARIRQQAMTHLDEVSRSDHVVLTDQKEDRRAGFVEALVDRLAGRLAWRQRRRIWRAQEVLRAGRV